PPRGLKEEMTKAIVKKAPKRIAGMKVREVRAYDGVKFILGPSCIIGGEAWLLLRPSGTEPLVRIYAEANSPVKVREMLKAGKQMIGRRQA
ncbi:phosphoglucosamine mutase, partial [Candidatus Desantisbacteria bacterium CG07_land_8_20_14_0_80_39_15]